jgi:F-type H+-transporting ATPase subunit delta
MFVPQRWALAFIHSAPDTGAAAEGLEFIRALSPVIRSARGNMAGTAAAAQLETMVRAAFAAGTGSSPAADARSRMPRPEELALCLILLLVRKRLFKHIDQVIRSLERELDALRGVLRVRLESARTVEGEFPEELKQVLMKKTGAAEVRLETAVTPELLAGYRLRIGSQIIETSLRLHLRQLGTELATMYAETHDENDAAHGGF